ncbi:MAG: DUF6773 family protein [Balneolaceae bacterium]|nr:DUF6773 family protein [Balneolaceae bacterium]
MTKKNASNTQPVTGDERTRAVTDRYYAHAFTILAFYIFLGLVVKPFLFDIPMWHYWDAGIVLIGAYAYVLVRTAGEGVAVEPQLAWDRMGWKRYLKVYGTAALLFGAFCTLVLPEIAPEASSWFEGALEKIGGGLLIALLFLATMSLVLFLIDYLPARAARRNADRMMDEG